MKKDNTLPTGEKEQSLNKKALTAGLWYVIALVVSNSITIITTPIFARLLTKSELGITSTYTAWLQIFTVLATLNIHSSINLSKIYFDKDNNKFLSSIFTLSTGSLVIVYAITKVVNVLFPQVIALPEGTLDILFAETFFTSAFTALQTQHRVYLRYKGFALLAFLKAFFAPLFGILLVLAMEQNKYYGRIIGGVIPIAIFGAVIAVLIMKRGKTLYNRDYWKFALAYAVPLIPHALSGMILNHSDRIIINSISSAADAGMYSLAYTFASILSVLWSALNQAWSPWFYEKMHSGDVSDIRKFSKPYVSLFFVLAVGMLVIGPEAILIFGSEKYRESMWILPPVLLGFFMQFMYSLFVNIEMYNKKTGIVSVGTCTAAVVNIVLNFIFIPIFGYVAAAYTTLVGYIIMLVVHYIFACRIERRDIYGKRMLASFIAAMTVITVVIGSLYRYPLPRYLLAAVLLAGFVYLMRGDIVAMLPIAKGKRGGADSR